MIAVSFVRESVEYLTVTVTADVELDDQPVAVSIDGRETWLPCAWQGDPGTTRQARTVSPVTFDTPLPSITSVYVKVTDNPEVPIIRAGSLNIV